MTASNARVHIIGAGPSGMACVFTYPLVFFNTFWNEDIRLAASIIGYINKMAYNFLGQGPQKESIDM